MKKRTYRSKKINQINWAALSEQLNGEKLVFAIDIAKHDQFAKMSTADGAVSELVKWKHPEESFLMLDMLESLGSPVCVVMESTSTYGDAIRYHCRERGFEIHQANAKRVHDAREVFDGVPSLHDAKAATIIANLFWQGLTSPWHELNDRQRSMNALFKEFDIHQSQYQRNLNRLEASLSRHWPEISDIITLDTVSLEQLLLKYGSPQAIATNPEEAEDVLRDASRGRLSQGKIDRILVAARTTRGVPCIEAERRYLQALAQEMMHSRLQKKAAQTALEEFIDEDTQLTYMGRFVGKVTSAILLSLHLDPRDYDCARSYEKAMGMNLKEKSSGKFVGQLKLTKRGSGKARQYLYFAALRLIQTCPLAKRWYDNKAVAGAKNKAVVAVMRKMAAALWHIARGDAYQPEKLFNVSAEAA